MTDALKFSLLGMVAGAVLLSVAYFSVREIYKNHSGEKAISPYSVGYQCGDKIIDTVVSKSYMSESEQLGEILACHMVCKSTDDYDVCANSITDGLLAGKKRYAL